MIYNKPITSGIELCRAMAPTALSMDHATEADDMEPTRALQIPRWESCDHIAGMIPRFWEHLSSYRFSKQIPATLK